MEGNRPWVFTAPAFEGSSTTAGAPAAAANAHYCPAGWKRRRKRSKRNGAGKRRKADPQQQPGVAAAAAAAAAVPAAPSTSADPAQLAPLRCSWPHPALLHLLMQQCWPAAGAAAVVQGAWAAAQLPGPLQRWHPPWWNRMLPSLSLLHPPLAPAMQLHLLAAAEAPTCSPPASIAGSYGGSSCRDFAGNLSSLPLPQPNVLVGYEDDWLEVAPEVLPLWAATPLAPFAGPKPLLHYLVCPEEQAAQAQQLIKDVGSLYETCNLGSHTPASGTAVHAFTLGKPPSGGSAATGDAWRRLQLAARYLVGVRHACERVQRQLLLDPPAELLQQQGLSLEDGAEPAVLVYVACPLRQQEHLVAALLEAAACLAPCTPWAAAAAAGAGMTGRTGTVQGLDLAGSGQPPPAPCEPQPPDRPAGATPAANSSRAPGSAPIPGEQPEGAHAAAEQQGLAQEQQAAAAAQQQQQQQLAAAAAQQQRYHGASQVLYHQQRGDFRHVPVRLVHRSEGSRPVNIVLQVLSPQALEDISGTAARCTAFALYSKLQHMPLDGPEQLLPAAAAPEPGEAAPPPVPFCSQPLMTLASASAAGAAADQQQGMHIMSPPPQQSLFEEGEEQEDGVWSEGGTDRGRGRDRISTARAQQCRTLHCCYGAPVPGSGLLPLAFADTCGELLHAELLDTSATASSSAAVGGSAAGMVAGSLLPSSLGSTLTGSLLSSTAPATAAAATGVARPKGQVSGSCTASQVCSLVLRRCLEVLAMLRAASNPPNLLHSLAICSLGMRKAEQQAWNQVLEQDAGLHVELPPGAELAVLDVQAPPPARFAGPDPPSGCRLVLDSGTCSLHDSLGPKATVVWLSPADGTSGLLPREHDTVRALEVALVARCQADGQAEQQSQEASLSSAARELHGLAWLHAAFQGACLHSVAGMGQEAGTDAHLPLHAALAGRLQALLVAAASHATCSA